MNQAASALGTRYPARLFARVPHRLIGTMKVTVFAATALVVGTASFALAQGGPGALVALARDADVGEMLTRAFASPAGDARSRFAAARLARYSSDSLEALSMLAKLSLESDPFVADEAFASAIEIVRAAPADESTFSSEASAAVASAWRAVAEHSTSRADRAAVATWISDVLAQRAASSSSR